MAGAASGRPTTPDAPKGRQVPPHMLTDLGKPHSRRGMIGGHHRSPVSAGRLAVHVAQGRTLLEQLSHGRTAEQNDQVRVDDLDLRQKPGLAACFQFVGPRASVAGRSALHAAGQKYLASGEALPLQEFVEKVARSPAEGLSARILACPRRLSDDHDPGVRRALSGYRVPTPGPEPALPAAFDAMTQRVELPFS